MTAYRLKLDVFEGPLDVLLYLIRRDEIDIYDIPIAHVAEQYIAFLEQAQNDNLDIAGEFLLMAATLVQIKSRMLLPVTQDDDDDDMFDETDPRTELVERLIEYRQFRDVARQLHDRAQKEQDFFPRPGARIDQDQLVEQEPVPRAVGEVNLYDLLTAFNNVLRYAKDAPIAEIEPLEFTLEQSIKETSARLKKEKSMRFSDMFEPGANRMLLVCTFLAILELIRTGYVRARQGRVLGEIRVYWTGDQDDAIYQE